MRTLALVVLVACGSQTQSAADAMKLVCDAETRAGAANQNPAERTRAITKWLEANVTNAEIRRLIATTSSVDPRTRRALLSEAARKHGIAQCPFAQPRPVLETVPEVTGPGVVPQDESGLVIAVSATEITIDGTAVLAVTGGDVEPSERVGITIPRIQRFVEALPTKPTRALVAFDAATRYRLVFAVLGSVSMGGVSRLAVAGRKDGAAVMVPITVPKRTPQGFTPRDVDDPEIPIQLVVTLTRNRLQLWSLSGLEGTLQAPKLDQPRGPAATRALLAALAEIVARRFPGDTRADEADRTIILMLDADLTAGDLLETASMVAELFPNVLLASGIE